MKVLITGRGTSGSWQIRAVQLGAAIGATVQPDADAKTIAAHDIVVLVKRPSSGLIDRIQSLGKPLVYDVVDAWPQPRGNEWGFNQCTDWLMDRVEEYEPVGIVAATKQMAVDLATHRVLWLPHHARPGAATNPIRERVHRVGYEGAPHYLGRWEAVVRSECDRRGWEFVLNPASLADLDIVVAFRDYCGYAARQWKSNVKLANAQGSGTPIILGRENGYTETASGGEVWCDEFEALPAALDSLLSQESRQRAARQLFGAAITVDAAAQTYLNWLKTLL